MPEINLLPWRATRREERRKQFFLLLGASAVIALFGVFTNHLIIAKRIRLQNQRNQYLSNQIKILDQKIEEIKTLKDARAKLLSRMEIIQTLQSIRPLSVHLFEQLVFIVPDGIYLTDIKRAGDTITLTGKAESNTNISNLMRNIVKSKWLGSPMLSEIITEDKTGVRKSHFNLTMQLVSPAIASQEADA